MVAQENTIVRLSCRETSHVLQIQNKETKWKGAEAFFLLSKLYSAEPVCWGEKSSSVLPRCEPYWHNTKIRHNILAGAMLVWLATYFLLGFEACSTGLGKPTPSTVNLVKSPLAEALIGPRKEPTTIVLLNAHVLNCLPNTHMHICR